MNYYSHSVGGNQNVIFFKIPSLQHIAQIYLHKKKIAKYKINICL